MQPPPPPEKVEIVKPIEIANKLDPIEIINQCARALEVLREQEERLRNLLGNRDGDVDERRGKTKETLKYAHELSLVVCAMEGIENTRHCALKDLAKVGCDGVPDEATKVKDPKCPPE